MADAALAKTLLALMSEETAPRAVQPLPASGTVEGLIGLARHHRALGYLAAAAPRLRGVDEATADELARYHRTHVTDQLRAIADLSALGLLLAGADIPWLVIKGPVLAALIYPRPELRTFEDVDIVVPQSAFADVIRVLEGAGLEIVDRNWELIRSERRGQLHITLPNGTVADVHWHLLNRDYVREGFRIEMGPVFDRARTVRIDGLALRTLSDVDGLVHLCLHAALAGGDRLIWLKDVDLAVAAGTTWPDVVRLARSWRAATAVGTILARAAQAFGTPVPDDVLRELLPRWRRGVGSYLDRRWPVEQATGALTPAALWAQTQRDGGGAWVGALAWRLIRRPFTFLRRRVARELWRGEGSGAVLLPSGGAEDREAFLRDVSHPSRGAGAA